MANPPVKKWSKGKMTVSMWKGEYQGKPTTSFSIQKTYKQGEEWKHSNFYSEPDLRDLNIIISHICGKTVKEKKIEPKPEPAPEQMPAGEEDVDF